MNIPLVTLIVVFIFIAIRQVGNIRIQIWQAMAMGASVVLLTGQISPRDALLAINFDVIIFLFGMFVIGQALEESGYLAHISYKYFKKARTVDSLIIFILFGFGCISALLMNYTIAIIGTPVVLLLAKKHKMSPKMLLLALAFSITIGSVASPIGNPQNLLIALNGRISDPFGEFFRWLFIPTILNLIIAYFIIRIFYRNDFHNVPLSHSQEPIRFHNLAFLSKLSLQMALVLVALKIITVVLRLPIEFRLTYIAVACCLPILIGSPMRWKIIKNIDWHTLVFFASMFVLMESVWQTGFFQNMITRSKVDITSIFTILCSSVLISQFISNVPMVALYQPVLIHSGITVKGFMALAAGSTIAGNLLILGAASNIIIIQNAEKRSHHTLTFLEFAKIGIPLTIINILIYWLFI